MYESVVRAGELLAAVVDGLDPDAVSGAHARELWSAFDRAEKLCAAGKTLLARRVAATHQRRSGTRSAADELARRSGSSPTEMKRGLETSQRLPEQRPVDGALRRGELSAAQAAAISKVVAADPTQADRLVQLAGRVSLRELEEECARVRAAADPDPRATNQRLHQRRRVSCYTDSEGFWNLRAQGTPQAGAAFTAVLDALTDAIFNQARSEGRREPYPAYAFDALMGMADHVGGRFVGTDQTGNGGPDHAAANDGDAAADHLGSDESPHGPAGSAQPNDRTHHAGRTS